MFRFIKEKAATMALNKFKEKFVNPDLKGIAAIREIAFRDGRLVLSIILDGLEDKPINVDISDIQISADGASVMIGNLSSNMPFAENALKRFLPNPLPVPEGKARTAAAMVKKILSL